jgi:hypothetical protein
MARRWRKDQIQEDYTQEQWNEMHRKAASGELTDELTDWNELYNTGKHSDDADVKAWNEDQKPNA